MRVSVLARLRERSASNDWRVWRTGGRATNSVHDEAARDRREAKVADCGRSCDHRAHRALCDRPGRVGQLALQRWQARIVGLVHLRHRDHLGADCFPAGHAASVRPAGRSKRRPCRQCDCQSHGHEFASVLCDNDNQRSATWKLSRSRCVLGLDGAGGVIVTRLGRIREIIDKRDRAESLGF